MLVMMNTGFANGKSLFGVNTRHFGLTCPGLKHRGWRTRPMCSTTASQANARWIASSEMNGTIFAL